MGNKAFWEKCNTKDFWADIAPQDHVVQLYEDDDMLIGTLSDYASNGFNAGDSLVVIATTGHIKALNQELRERGYDISALMEKDLYIPLDATETLSMFMVNGLPDEKSFFDTVAPIMDRASKSGVQVRAFGEMVALLWERGEGHATIQLENLWNKFSETEKFCLFCAYPKEGFKNDAGASIMHICSTHNKVIGSDLDYPLDIQYRNVV